MRSQAPSRLDRYALGDVIGVGGMGTVVRATDQVLGREVAVKLLREEYSGDPEALARFRQEARIAASLSHPGIAAVYDFLEEQGRQALVMELLDGQDLHAVVERDGPMAPEAAAGIAAEAAEALAYAHALGAVHRDVKPANIFLTKSGVVKLTDFGVAYAGANSLATVAGTLIGTPDFLSPEQVQGERATAASDLYSLGCVVFQLVTGRPPFSGDNPVAVATARLDVPPPSARAANPAVSPALDRVISRAMARRPQERFADAQAMAQALRQAARSDPGVTQVMAVPARGEAGTTWGGGPATIVEAAGLAPLAPLAAPRRGPATLPVRGRARQQHRLRWLWASVILVLMAGMTMDIVATWRKSTAPVKIPAWTGMSFDAASSAARGMGFSVKRVDRGSQLAAGTVLSTAPAAGTMLKRGLPVTMEVSLGNLLALPDVTTMTLDSASALLKGKGLSVTISAQTVPGTTDNLVDSQNPVAGTVVARGSSVTLVGTKVPPPAPLPTPGSIVNQFLNLFGLGSSPAPAPTQAPARKHGGNG